MFDLDDFRYYIGNPSGWNSYDQKMSDPMRDAADEIERLRVDAAQALIICDSYATENQQFHDEIERLRAALESLTKDPPATLDEPDDDAEVIIKMRAIARDASNIHKHSGESNA